MKNYSGRVYVKSPLHFSSFFHGIIRANLGRSREHKWLITHIQLGYILYNTVYKCYIMLYNIYIYIISYHIILYYIMVLKYLRLLGCTYRSVFSVPTQAADVWGHQGQRFPYLRLLDQGGRSGRNFGQGGSDSSPLVDLWRPW